MAGVVGTVIGWYDSFIYGAATVFDQLFFPEFAPPTGTMAAFGTYALLASSRDPLGGVVFGDYGDKSGRKAMLVITLMLMGVAGRRDRHRIPKKGDRLGRDRRADEGT
jgi:MFS transporter, MHS family, shikimate and dehydroshikimate transport protein